MSGRIVLISDDENFFEFIKSKLELRKSDEVYMYAFNDIPERIHLLESAVLVVNSENSQSETLDLIKIFRGTPIIVMSYNEDENYKKKCYRAGAFDYMPILISDSEFRARILPALSVADILQKNAMYREILTESNILSKNNEVFISWENIINNELIKLQKKPQKAIFMAISPDDKEKFLITPNKIETAILCNIRKNDILMNYSPNKYFLMMFDTDMKSAEKVWNKIASQISQPIYAGIIQITNQNRQQLVNNALNRLHESITKKNPANKNIITSDFSNKNATPYSNFKLFRQEFWKKIEHIITPAFYGFQQKYSGKLLGMKIEPGVGDGYGTLFVKGKNLASAFKITCPGFSAVNIDITLQKGDNNVDTKRITLSPSELETGVIDDLLEQFIAEIKAG